MTSSTLGYLLGWSFSLDTKFGGVTVTGEPMVNNYSSCAISLWINRIIIDYTV